MGKLKEELLKTELSEWGEEIPLLDNIYVIPTRRKHDSGYMCMEVIGEVINIKTSEVIYRKRLATYSDVIDIEKIFMGERTMYPLSLDIPEYGVLRFFARGFKFKIRHTHISVFSFSIVSDECED